MPQPLMPKKWNGLDSSGNLPYDTESSNPVLHGEPRGVGAMGSGRAVQEEGDMWTLLADLC